MEDLLYDHYKDTNIEKKAAIKERNKAFAFLLVAVCLLGFYAYDPSLIESSTSALVSQWGVNIVVSGTVLQTILWLVTLYIYIRYLQTVATVERTYLYLNQLEAQLSAREIRVDREGDDYSKEWPILLKAIDCLYKIFFIIAFVVVLLLKVLQEGFPVNLFGIIDWVSFFAFLVLTTLYWAFLYDVDKEY